MQVPMSNEWSWSNETRFATDPATAKKLLDELLGQLSSSGWTEQEVFGVHLAAEEALMNAIKHGNQLDAGKSVDLTFRVSPDIVEIEIEDEGGGFDPEDVPDPTEDENLEIPSGRGLMLMRTFMTQVEFNEVGNRVFMQRDKNAPLGDDDDDDDFYADD